MRGLTIALAAFVGLSVGMLVGPPTVGGDAPCVPGYAVNYNGAGFWEDREGRAVLLAENEDTYDWCTK